MSAILRRMHWLGWMFLAGSLLWILLGHEAHAATACVHQRFCHSFALFDAVDDKAHAASDNWVRQIVALVTNTFWILATIEICWAAAVWVYEKDTLNSLAVEVIKKIMFIAFFFTVLQNASAWIPKIVASFQAVGQQVANAPNLTTDYIIASGLAICNMIMGSAPHINIINVWGLIPKYIVAAFVCLGVVLCAVLMAAEYFCAVMESYILFATGAVFLGFGSSTWTKDYVTKYLNYAIAVGTRLLIMLLIWALFAFMAAGDPFTFDYLPMLEQLAIIVLQCLLFLKAPEMANALLNGGSGVTHSAMTGVAAGAAATGFLGLKALGALKTAGGVAGGMAMGGIRSAVSAAQGIGNFAKAAKAGRELAQQEGKSGSDARLEGLDKAAEQVARNMPRSILNAIKSGSRSRQNQGPMPGPLKRAREALEEKAVAGRSGGDDSSNGNSS